VPYSTNIELGVSVNSRKKSGFTDYFEFLPKSSFLCLRRLSRSPAQIYPGSGEETGNKNGKSSLFINQLLKSENGDISDIGPSDHF